MALFNQHAVGFGEIFHSNVCGSPSVSECEKGVGPGVFPRRLLWLPCRHCWFLGPGRPALGIGISEPDTVGPLVARVASVTASLLGVLSWVFCFRWRE